MIRPSKEMGAIIRQSAAAENMSVQRYVLQTLYARTGATGGGVALDGHALFRQRTHAEEKRRVRPVALDDRALRQMTSLLTGNRPHRPHFGDGQLGKLKCILRHGDVSRGFQRAGHHKKTVSDQQRQRHEKARNILRGHIACDRIVSPDQLSTAIQHTKTYAGSVLITLT